MSLSPRTSASSRCVVLDNGAFTVKAGMAGESSPRYTVPNCTACAKNQFVVKVRGIVR